MRMMACLSCDATWGPLSAPRVCPECGKDGAPIPQVLQGCAYPGRETHGKPTLDPGIVALLTALRALVEKLDIVAADSRYEAVWVSYMVHGGRYSGPTYSAELEAAKLLLAAHHEGAQE